ncbi:MAG: hypothetical protein ACYTGN_03945 [Planctomycetota bacterium]
MLLAVALKSRGAQPEAAQTESSAAVRLNEAPQQLTKRRVAGGVDLRVSHTFAGSISRASLVYDDNGKEQLVDKSTNCRKALGGNGVASTVELRGRIPEGVTDLRVVVEDETGVRILPVHLED